MVKTTVTKNKFSQFHDKKFNIPDGVVSLSFHHLVLAEIDDFKKTRSKNRKIFLGGKRKFV